MKRLLLVLLLMLPGCTSLVGQLPSLQMCDEVSYHRKGSQAKLIAECTLPAGTGFTL